MKVRDIMSKYVVMIKPDKTVDEVAGLIVLGYLVYFTVSLSSLDAGQYYIEKSLRNIETTELPEIYKNAAAFNGKINSLMYVIVAVGALGIAVLTFLEYLKFVRLARK